MPDDPKLAIEAVLHQGLDISPDCFGVLDENNCILYCNSICASIFGTTKEKAHGQHAEDLLRKAWHSKQGVRIETDDIEAWLQNVYELHQQKPINQFEIDMVDGRWYQMTRMNMENGYKLLFGVDITLLKKTQRELELANHEIERLANQDQLTGVYNRRAFEQAAGAEFERAKRYDFPLSLLLLDVDYFKQVNDKYGHEGGDKALAKFAATCAGLIRQSDAIFRIGGEEFVILLPNTERDDAFHLAERIRAVVEHQGVEVNGSFEPVMLTTSIGVGSIMSHDGSIDQVLLRADQALYHAKKAGRNQVSVGH